MSALSLCDLADMCSCYGPVKTVIRSRSALKLNMMPAMSRHVAVCCAEYVKKYAKADDIASKHGSDGSGSDDDAAFLSSSDDDEETPGEH